MTFLSYGKSDILGLGYKTEQVNGRVYVNFCWCKVCAKNKDVIIQNTTLRGTQNLPRWLSLMEQML